LKDGYQYDDSGMMAGHSAEDPSPWNFVVVEDPRMQKRIPDIGSHRPSGGAKLAQPPPRSVARISNVGKAANSFWHRICCGSVSQNHATRSTQCWLGRLSTIRRMKTIREDCHVGAIPQMQYENLHWFGHHHSGAGDPQAPSQAGN
jgi:hypothetical protein